MTVACVSLLPGVAIYRQSGDFESRLVPKKNTFGNWRLSWRIIKLPGDRINFPEEVANICCNFSGKFYDFLKKIRQLLHENLMVFTGKSKSLNVLVIKAVRFFHKNRLIFL